jgi:hypothetical protein
MIIGQSRTGIDLEVQKGLLEANSSNPRCGGQ